MTNDVGNADLRSLQNPHLTNASLCQLFINKKDNPRICSHATGVDGIQAIL